MPTNAEYEALVTGFNHGDLVGLWDAVRNGVSLPQWGSGRALEYLILRAYQLEGAQVRWPYDVRVGGNIIEQIDGSVHFDAISCLIECKNYAYPINGEAIGKLHYALTRRPPAAIGAVFSRSGFTQPAMALASFSAPQRVLLWDGDEIDYALRSNLMREVLTKKFRFAVDMGISLYYALEAALP